MLDGINADCSPRIGPNNIDLVTELAFGDAYHE